MSDDEEFDDTPPEACFFTNRATFVPKVSNEEFLSVAKLLSETEENKLSFIDKRLQDKVKFSKKGKSTKSEALKKIGQLSDSDGDIDVIDNHKDSSPAALSSPALLSSATKRRLKRQQAQRANELKLIEAANQEIFSAVDSTSFDEVEEVDLEDSSDSCNKTILTVSYKSEVSRLRCNENEKFSSIFPKVANLFHLKASEILLCLQEQNIKVDDTPQSLNITLNDILECIPYKPTEEDVEESFDKFKIYFQSSNTKDKIELSVHKLEKMQDIMQRYADLLETPVDKLSFEFDGDKIEGTETPEDLDMDAGNCIDVKFLEGSAVTVKRKAQEVQLSNTKQEVEERQVSVPRGTRGRGRGRGRARGRRTNFSTRKRRSTRNSATVISLDDSSASRDSDIVPLVTTIDDSNTSRDSDIVPLVTTIDDSNTSRDSDIELCD